MDLSNYTQLITPNSTVSVSNLQVSGTSTTVNTSDLLIQDNKVVLNRDAPTGSLDASLIVNRGSDANVALVWSESLGKWQQTRDGTVFLDIPASTGELREDPNNLYFTNARVNTALAEFTGDLNAGNATFANTVTANYLVGNVSYNNITDLPILKKTFDFASTTSLIGIVPAHAVITRVEILITTAFSNNLAKLSVGTMTNTIELAETTDSSLGYTGLYTTLPGVIYITDTQVGLSINTRNSTAGAGTIIIYF